MTAKGAAILRQGQTQRPTQCVQYKYYHSIMKQSIGVQYKVSSLLLPAHKYFHDSLPGSYHWLILKFIECRHKTPLHHKEAVRTPGRPRALYFKPCKDSSRKRTATIGLFFLWHHTLYSEIHDVHGFVQGLWVWSINVRPSLPTHTQLAPDSSNTL